MAFTTTLAMAEAFRIPAFRIPFSCTNLLNVKHASRLQFCPAFVGTSLRQSSSYRFLRIQSSSRSRPATLGHGHLAITASTESSETEEINDFASLGLDYRLVDALTKMGFTKPTRVQHESIPSIVKGTDVVMGAETGSGKTLAYLLPLFHQLLKSQDAVGLEYDNLPEALVLVPNQELANQVMLVLQSFQVANPELSFPAIVLAGAGGLPRSKQCAVCIATASAVLRHTEPEFFDNTTYVVVDEADMMLDGGFVTDVIRILDFIKPRVSNTMRRRMPRATEAELEALLPRRPAQVVFAAATLPDWTGDKVKSVVRWLRKQYPAAAHINTDRLHLESDRVEQQWVDLGPDDDPLAAMAAALDRVGARRSMVFVNTVARAKEAQAFLESLGRPAQAVHKEVPAAERAAALQAFRAAGEGERAVLVCTDLAARGLDIPAVGHVVQLDFALSAVAHLHRVGRTGRAGAGGLVTNLVDERSRAVAEAIRNEAGLPLAPIFSRNRGFRRRLRRTGTGRAQIDGPAAAASGEPSSGAARRVSSPRRAGKGDGLGDASDEQAAPGPQSPSQAAA